ncbi:hypothetical protein D4764_16G0004630 [Takifugu flavidus]|uniref:TCL1 upstream neural differentiation-associated RNA n=2 Tax=Takifugu flavidus TaxID=433684 RepID=A0A5C6NYL6_9TELE|nr:hypothetical protein D4764_16G0004630 [Takifugu flavidus]
MRLTAEERAGEERSEGEKKQRWGGEQNRGRGAKRRRLSQGCRGESEGSQNLATSEMKFREEAQERCELPGMWGHERQASTSSMSNAILLLMLCKIGLRRKVQTFPGKMVNTLHSDEEKGSQDKESKEESILAMLGIIGTILNLLVIIFVYIYTTL